MSALLTVQDVSVRFGGLQAVSHVSFDVAESEIVGIIGPNGAGKTTLLNAVSGFARVHGSASISFLGRELLRSRPQDRARLGIARTFQSLEQSPKDSVLSNVLSGAHLRAGAGAVWGLFMPIRRLSPNERRLLIEAYDLLRLFEIDAWSDTRLADTPYAVRKRAQVCRALISRPQLLLLDEGGSGMSASEKQQLRQTLMQIRRDQGVSLIVIEHDVDFISKMSDRVIALNFGEVIAQGRPDEVTQHPAVIEAYIGVSADA